MYDSDTHFTPDSGAGSASSTTSTAKDTAKQAAGSAKQVASEVTDTAKQQGRQVAEQVGTQARSVVADVRQTVAGQVRTGHGKAADQVRRFAEDLGNLTGETSSPAGQLVQQISHTGHRAADYLQDRGPEGLLEDVQTFARRKPGTFLLAAAAAGFVIGRLGRSTAKAARSDDAAELSTLSAPTGNVYQHDTGYDAGYTTPAPIYSEDPYPASTTPTYATTGTTGVGYQEPAYPTDPVVVPDRGTLR